MNWLDNFDERQQKEIESCLLYAQDFGHGTEDGHSAKLIIARMAAILSTVENILLSEDHPGKQLKVEIAMGLAGLAGPNEASK